MMSLWAPNATVTIGPGMTATGKERDPAVLARESVAFQPRDRLDLGSPRVQGPRSRSTVTGARCTSSATTSTPRPKKVAAVTAADMDVARIDGRWLITNMVGGIDRAEALSLDGGSGTAGTGSCRRREARPLSPGDDPLVRAVGRLPAKVHTKLLVAFVGTALLVVAVGVLGLRVLGQSNDRVERLGALQERAVAYGKLQSDTAHVRLLLAENVGADFYKVWTGTRQPTGRGRVAVDQAIVNELERIAPSTLPDRLGFVPPAEDESVLREIRAKSGRALGGHERDHRFALRRRAERFDAGGARSPSTSTSSPRCSPTRRRRRPRT